MICSLGLVLTLAFTSLTSARLGVEDGRQVIEVVHRGVKSTIESEYQYQLQSQRGSVFESGHTRVLFHGRWFRGERYRVQNSDTKEWGQAFGKPVNGCGGGFVYGGKMVWIYYVAEGDISCEPISGVYAFIMDEIDGIATLEKSIALAGICGNWDVISERHGEWLLVYSTAGERSLGILNLKTLFFKIIVGVKPNYPGAVKPYDAETPDTGCFAICSNGRIYANLGDMLSFWNWKELKWKPVRKLKAETWTRAYSMGFDDLLVGQDGMALAHKGKTFALPPSRSLFISPKLGIGVVYNASFPFADGVLMSPKDLTKICKVDKYIPATAKDSPVRATMTTGKR